MVTSRILHYAESLQSVPTAPYREQWILPLLDRHLAEIPGLAVRIDEYGNRIARLTRGTAANPPVAFVAHLDHPGFVVEEVLPGGKRLRARFEGGVDDEFFLGTRVRAFRAADDAGIAGVVASISIRASNAARNREAIIECESDATGARLAMWDLAPAFEPRDGVLHARIVDDLFGVASILEVLRRCAAGSAPVDVIGVFTRAEETGFRGAIGVATAAEPLVPRDATVVSVETSSERPFAPVGGGAIIRVGDRMSIFAPDVTAALTDAASELAKEGALTQPPRRALMDGGSCEGTVFHTYGWRTGAVCVPLGNYHNMNKKTNRIDREYVAASDAEDLATLMTRLAERGVGPDPHGARNRAMFAEYLEHARADLLT